MNGSHNMAGVWRAVATFLSGVVVALVGSVWAGVRGAENLEARFNAQAAQLSEVQAEVKENREQFARLRERVTALEARMR